ncbi:hypothetical protein ACHAXT_013300 [Thalassiosira profunda]
MAGSKKTERNRQLRQNRAAGIGDETGRIPVRQKEAGTTICCVVCKAELKCTKTNTEMKTHAMSKHGQANYEESFPGAEAVAPELAAKVAKGGGSAGGGKGGTGGGPTKKEKKKQMAAGLDDLLSAGLDGGKKKGKGKGK